MKPFLFVSFILFGSILKAQSSIDSMYAEADSLYAEDFIGFEADDPITFGTCGFDPPIFPGGLDSLSKFILPRFDYSLYDEKLSGVVYISFVVDTAGFIKNVKVARGIHPEIDAACLAIIKSLPQWVPSKDSKGIQTPVNLVMPFRFSGKD